MRNVECGRWNEVGMRNWEGGMGNEVGMRKVEVGMRNAECGMLKHGEEGRAHSA